MYDGNQEGQWGGREGKRVGGRSMIYNACMVGTGREGREGGLSRGLSHYSAQVVFLILILYPLQ